VVVLSVADGLVISHIAHAKDAAAQAVGVPDPNVLRFHRSGEHRCGGLLHRSTVARQRR
jgi:hypothetical protein